MDAVDVVPLVDEGLGNSSYLVALGEGRALVIDPARHPGSYLRAAEQRGLDIAYAAETHLHADFVSGARELRSLGAQVRQARNVGFEQLLGELYGGVDAWTADGHPLHTIRLTPAADIDGPVLDVRQASEYHSGHLPDAVHAELGTLLEADLPPDPLPVMCGHGERAMTAASLLARTGRRDLTVAVGGPDDWATAHRRALTHTA